MLAGGAQQSTTATSGGRRLAQIGRGQQIAKIAAGALGRGGAGGGHRDDPRHQRQVGVGQRQHAVALRVDAPDRAVADQADADVVGHMRLLGWLPIAGKVYHCGGTLRVRLETQALGRREIRPEGFVLGLGEAGWRGTLRVWLETQVLG